MSSKIVLEKLRLRNFLSFGNNFTEINLNILGSTLILGENIDAGGANGCGKTAIINAICYAFFNKPFDNISLQRLINSTNKSKNTLMEVELTFKKGEDSYTIKRSRGESFNIKVHKNDDDITLDSVNENDKLITDILGMSYELFTKIIIFSGNSIPFFLMPVSQQRQQIEELFNITILSEKAVKLKEIIKETETNISVEQALCKEKEAQIVLYEKQLGEAESRITKWDLDKDSQIKRLTESLETFAKVNIKEEKELHQLISESSSEQSKLNNKLILLKKDKSSLLSDIKKLTGEIIHLKDDKCPYCLQNYQGAMEKLKDKELLLKEKNSALEKLETQLVGVQGEVDDVTSIINDAKKSVFFKSLSEALKAESSAEGAQQKIDDLLTAVNPHVEARDQLKNQVVKKVSYDEIDRLKKELEHQQFLLKLLTDKNSFIRRKIINRTIPFLNKRLNFYTKELGLPHTVKFDDDMSCSISEYDRELDFGNLSNGEKKRVNLALSLAFRDVLHHLHAKINCLFLDEIDGSLDSSGVENMFRLFKQKSREDNMGMWIISHRPEAIGRFDRTITIRKENGFSNILEGF
jgi:DNA repair exonuclease SbcCD ATPase subunit